MQPNKIKKNFGPPARQGLYDPAQEHDACGVGFVVNIRGEKSHQIVRSGLEILVNLAHRGACGCDPLTGDGAGILTQIPHDFFAAKAAELGIALPAPGEYGIGTIFLPRDEGERRHCLERFEAIVAEEGQIFLGWRDVPIDNNVLGTTARDVEPVIRQVFVARGANTPPDMLEWKLYVIRKRHANEIRKSDLTQKEYCYVPSFSSRVIIYKGLLLAEQVEPFYADLADERFVSALALVHQRYSTNTFPTWDLAHPFRYLAHNGEINTLRGNVNWMHARESMFASEKYGDDLKKICPVCIAGASDSAVFDNALELLVLTGRSLPEAMSMLIPEPWQNHESMSDDLKAYYEYQSCLLEPWDGPASMAFTDGTLMGAVLDRNGLRPSRYWVTKGGLVVMASEAGVLKIPPEEVESKGRLRPGRMFLVDTAQGRIIADHEIKQTLAARRPYRQWLNDNLVTLAELPAGASRQWPRGRTAVEAAACVWLHAGRSAHSDGPDGHRRPGSDRLNGQRHAFGRALEPSATALQLLQAIVRPGHEPATGCDPRGNHHVAYYDRRLRRQLARRNPRTMQAATARATHLDQRPARTDSPVERQAAREPHAFDSLSKGRGRGGHAKAPRRFEARGFAGDRRGRYDPDSLGSWCKRRIGADPCSAGHQRRAPPSGARREPHALRPGRRDGRSPRGASLRAIDRLRRRRGESYLAFSTLRQMLADGYVSDEYSVEKLEKNYVKAVGKGLLKVMSKMGISTQHSYRGAQIFEAIGLNSEFIEEFFTRTPSRIEGVGLEAVAEESIRRHEHAYPRTEVPQTLDLDVGGQYQWRRKGEAHIFSPDVIAKLQHSTQLNSREEFRKFCQLIDDQQRQLLTLRGLLDFKPSDKPVPLDEVEPAVDIVKRFATGAMSYGSISREAHETLAIAMNRIGGKSNTGEGGEDPVRFQPDANGDRRSSAIKQVASGRFGVTSEYLVSARELQIKMAQGAKPGEGGQLPGHKVDKEIARIRYSTPGVGLISPPPHHDIYSIEDLSQLIHDLKNANREARISVKLVAEIGVGTVAAGVSKGKSDVVLISGHDGGTGASPQTSIKHAGAPWELGLAETHQVLVLNDLRGRIVVQTDGQLRTARDVAIATMLGAEEWGIATAALVTVGCIMMRKCHLNTCPVGVATQDPELRKKFAGKPEHVVNYFFLLAEELREIMARLGFRTINEMVGRVDRLDTRTAIEHWKAKGLDFSAILHKPQMPDHVLTYCASPQDHGLERSIDMTLLLDLCHEALEHGEPVKVDLPIRNVHRTVGTILSSEVTRKYGRGGFQHDDTIQLNFRGSAGQSLMAFGVHGITARVEGDVNDYCGKGLSGGKIIVYPARESTFPAEDNIIAGNVVLYGATSGELYLRGLAGERFCVRNSGASAVVEGVGDHGCEYMTGGRAVILGKTGRNFAAGMSGGIAYVLDLDDTFPPLVNKEMVELEDLSDPADQDTVLTLVRKHVQYTHSSRGQWVLDNWKDVVGKFVKIMPADYKLALKKLEEEAQAMQSGLEVAHG